MLQYLSKNLISICYSKCIGQSRCGVLCHGVPQQADTVLLQPSRDVTRPAGDSCADITTSGCKKTPRSQTCRHRSHRTEEGGTSGEITENKPLLREASRALQHSHSRHLLLTRMQLYDMCVPDHESESHQGYLQRRSKHASVFSSLYCWVFQ